MILYSTGCPQCMGLKAALDGKGYAYEVCDDVQLMLNKGISAVPMLEVDNNLMSFKEAMQWVNSNGGDAQ